MKYVAVVRFVFDAEDKADAEETVAQIIEGGIAITNATYDVTKIVRPRTRKP